jgi:predicted DCC family thiol-disulfide oxidoreductase YuxK
MDTEITDNNGAKPAGSIYFDADCPFCVAYRRRWGRVFERRGFVWLPLQTPGAAHRLGVTDAQLRAAMWLQLADGRQLSGVTALSVLTRRVWWLWPLGVILALPCFSPAARVLYRWIAKNRHCWGGTCTIHSHEGTPLLPVRRPWLRVHRRLRSRARGEAPNRAFWRRPIPGRVSKPRRLIAFLELP